MIWSPATLVILQHEWKVRRAATHNFADLLPSILSSAPDGGQCRQHFEMPLCLVLVWGVSELFEFSIKSLMQKLQKLYFDISGTRLAMTSGGVQVCIHSSTNLSFSGWKAEEVGHLLR